MTDAAAVFTLIRSPRRKRTVALAIGADGAVRVLAPVRTSRGWIESFVAARAAWIARRRAALDARQRKKEATPPLADGAIVPFCGQRLRVRIVESGQTVAARDALSLSVPPALSPAMREEQARLSLSLWYKGQARRLFPARVAHWAAVTGLRPARVVVTAAKRRWGSCAADGVVRLNWRLVLLAPEVIDYVVVHELCHLRHRHHGPAFWRAVEDFLPAAKALRRQLRQAENDANLTVI